MRGKPSRGVLGRLLLGLLLLLPDQRLQQRQVFGRQNSLLIKPALALLGACRVPLVKSDGLHSLFVACLGCWVIEAISTEKKPLTDAIGRVRRLHDQYKFTMIYCDETGLGGGAVDSMLEFGLPVYPITFTLSSKNDLYSNLKWMMENQKLSYSRNEKLIFQLTELQYKYSQNGFLMISHPDRGHDDFSDALALACFGCRDSKGFGYIGSVGDMFR